MIEHQVAVTDIPATVLISDVGNTSKVEKYIVAKELVSVRHKRSALSAAHHIEFSEVADHIQLEMRCYRWQVRNLHRDLLLRLVKDSMAVERNIIDVPQALLLNELLDGVREEL